MNDLAAQQPAKPLTLIDCRISTGLWNLLSSPVPAEVEIATITRDPALHAEVKATVPYLAKVAEPCGGGAVRRLLQPLVMVYGIGEAARSAAFWKVYDEQLSGLPAEALDQAIRDYAGGAGAEFFPKPGPLKALAERRAEPIWKALSRARRAAKALPAPVIAKQDAETRKAHVAAMLAGFSRPPAANSADSHPPKDQAGEA